MSSRKIGKSTRLEARLTQYSNAHRREVFSAAQGFPRRSLHTGLANIGGQTSDWTK
jgi:hypothetical protein